jgi:hypothetical protein
MKISLHVLVLFPLVMSSTIIYSQDSGIKYVQQNKYSVAVFAGEYGYDAGIGFEIGSPTFSNNRLCLRLKGNVIWLEQYKAKYDRWAKYRCVGASIVYNFVSIENCRVFVEGGPLVIFPDKRYSLKNSYQGFTAAAGLEIFVLNSSSLDMCYYFSVGGIYSEAIAETLENQPKYGRGFVFTNGFRFYF